MYSGKMDAIVSNGQTKKRWETDLSHREDKNEAFKKQYAKIASRANSGLLGRARELGYSEEEIKLVPLSLRKT